MEFCEYCGLILNEKKRCPDEECVWNILQDKIDEIKKEFKEEEI